MRKVISLFVLVFVGIFLCGMGSAEYNATDLPVYDEATGFYNISTCSQLQNMKFNLTANYQLVNDIDCAETSSWNEGAGFEPIGNCGMDEFSSCDGVEDIPFNGSFNGNYYVIENLYSNWNIDAVGLFGYVDYGNFSNVYLKNFHLSGFSGVGGLVGALESRVLINNVGVVGDSVIESCSGMCGGMIGNGYGNNLFLSEINNSFNEVDIILPGANMAGGVGGYTSRFNYNNVYNTGNISGLDHLGGITGDGDYITFKNVYNTGTIGVNSPFIGGIIGVPAEISIIDSFNTGAIYSSFEGYEETDSSGSLSGRPTISVTVNNSYWLYIEGYTMDHCYSDALEIPQNDGCVMIEDPITQNYFFDSANEPLLNWDFETVWIEQGDDYPLLSWQLIESIMPIVYLFPIENSTSTSRTFTYNVSDDSAIANCKLYVENEEKSANITAVNQSSQNNELYFSPIGVGTYVSYISCIDQYGNIGNSNNITFQVLEEVEEQTTSGGGSSYTLSQNVLDEGLVRNVWKGVVWKFNAGNENHTITFNDIYTDSLVFTIASTPRIFTVKLNESILIDVEEDGVYDLNVTYNKYYGRLANVGIKAVSVKYGEEAVESGEAEVEVIVEPENYTDWIIGIIIVALIIVGLVLVNRKRSRAASKKK